MTPETAVLTRLLAIPAVVAIIGDRGFVHTLPQGVPAPYVRVSAISDVSRATQLRGGGGPREAQIQIDAFARETSGADAYAEVAALTAAIDGPGDGTGLDGYRGVVGDVMITGALRLDRMTRYDADEQRLVRFQTDYRVHYRRGVTRGSIQCLT